MRLNHSGGTERSVFNGRSTGVSSPLTDTVRKNVWGSYQRKQGHRRTYTYDGTFGTNSEGTWWMVTVRSESTVKGTPMGTLLTEESPTEKMIRQLVERQIEGLDQIQE